jgi:N-acetylglutamate synthase-like GNAT family acetyltransferase
MTHLAVSPLPARLLEKDRVDRARDLMDRVLRGGDPIAPEYPLVFRAQFEGRVLALGEGEAVLSSCAVLTRTLTAGARRIPIGLIGSVATEPTWRGRGLGTRLLIEAEAALQSQGAALALLWAEDPRFYLERGYCPAGGQEDFVLPKSFLGRLPARDGVREANEHDADAIHALYTTHPARVERTNAETRALLTCPGMTTLVRELQSGVVAYACLGRGGDLHDSIHEWGGAVDDVLAVARAHLERRFAGLDGGMLVLMAPLAARELRERLGVLGADSRRGLLGLAKLLDRRAAAQAICELLGRDAQVDLVTTPQGDRLRITGPRQASVLDDLAALALLLPACDVKPEVESFLGVLGLALPREAVDPFVWGLDSI